MDARVVVPVMVREAASSRHRERRAPAAVVVMVRGGAGRRAAIDAVDGAARQANAARVGVARVGRVSSTVEPLAVEVQSAVVRVSFLLPLGRALVALPRNAALRPAVDRAHAHARSRGALLSAAQVATLFRVSPLDAPVPRGELVDGAVLPTLGAGRERSPRAGRGARTVSFGYSSWLGEAVLLTHAPSLSD